MGMAFIPVSPLARCDRVSAACFLNEHIGAGAAEDISQASEESTGSTAFVAVFRPYHLELLFGHFVLPVL